jgi:hypothetical protein
MTDTRYVHGIRCTWHGPISAISTILARDGVTRLPCCPHCSGMLFEFPDKATWDNMVVQFDAKHPGYAEFIEWLGTVGRCWPNSVVAADAYTEATGKKVQLGT